MAIAHWAVPNNINVCLCNKGQSIFYLNSSDFGCTAQEYSLIYFGVCSWIIMWKASLGSCTETPFISSDTPNQLLPSEGLQQPKWIYSRKYFLVKVEVFEVKHNYKSVDKRRTKRIGNHSVRPNNYLLPLHLAQQSELTQIEADIWKSINIKFINCHNKQGATKY